MLCFCCCTSLEGFFYKTFTAREIMQQMTQAKTAPGTAALLRIRTTATRVPPTVAAVLLLCTAHTLPMGRAPACCACCHPLRSLLYAGYLLGGVLGRFGFLVRNSCVQRGGSMRGCVHCCWDTDIQHQHGFIHRVFLPTCLHTHHHPSSNVSHFMTHQSTSRSPAARGTLRYCVALAQIGDVWVGMCCSARTPPCMVRRGRTSRDGGLEDLECAGCRQT